MRYPDPVTATLAERNAYWQAEGYDHTFATYLALMLHVAGRCGSTIAFASFEPYLLSVTPDFNLRNVNQDVGSNTTCRPEFEWAYPF